MKNPNNNAAQRPAVDPQKQTTANLTSDMIRRRQQERNEAGIPLSFFIWAYQLGGLWEDMYSLLTGKDILGAGEENVPEAPKQEGPKP